MKLVARILVTTLLLLPAGLRAQEHAEPAGEQEAHAPVAGGHASNEIDIQHHLANSHVLEYPCFRSPYACELELPRWAPIHIGSLAIDLSPTNHSVFVVLAGLLVTLAFLYTSRAVARAQAKGDVPRGFAGDATAAIEAQVERFAPGFRETILARSVRGPADLERDNPNLVGGDIGAGENSLAQTVFRPARRIVPWATPVPGLFLCSAATPPGGGVHGMCGYHAARAVLRAFS